MLIVTYHAIRSPGSAVCTAPAHLDAELAGLIDAGFSFVSLDDCAEWLAGARALPPRAIAVTFDDGYESVAGEALPILARYRVPAAVFVIAGRLGADNQWPGQWRSIAAMPLLSGDAVRDLSAAGITIGCHGWSHLPLPSLDPDALVRELEDSRRRLEDLIGTQVRHFAYPYGLRGSRETVAVGKRYVTGATTAARFVDRSCSPFDLPRIDAHDLRMALRLRLSDPAAFRPYLAVRRALRHARQPLRRIGL